MPKAAFKQCDVERLIRAARAAGCAQPAVEVRPDGTLRLLTASAPRRLGAASDADAALEAWREAQDGGGGAAQGR